MISANLIPIPPGQVRTDTRPRVADAVRTLARGAERAARDPASREYAALVTADIQSVQAGPASASSSEPQHRRHPDGSEETVDTQTVPGGQVVTKVIRNPDGSSVKIIESTINGDSHTEITHVKSDGSVLETRTTDIPADPRSPSYEYYKRFENGAMVESRTTRGTDGDGNPTTEVETWRESQRVHWVRTTEILDPKLNLPGSGTIGAHCPQDLLKHLGDEDKIRQIRVEEEWLAADGSMQHSDTVRMTSGDGKVELLEHKSAEGAASAWELRRRKEDGSWNSQIFFQGSEDTIVNTTRQEGKWQIQESKASLSEQAEASEGQVPEQVDGTSFRCESATVTEIEQRLDDSPLSKVRECESFRHFVEAYGQTFEAILSFQTRRYSDKSSEPQGLMYLKAANGSSFQASFDGKQLVAAICSPGRTEPDRLSVMQDGERLEMGQDGQLSEVVDGVRTPLAGTVTTMGLVGSTGSRWASRLGGRGNSALAPVVAFQLASALVDGDMELATAKAGELGLSVQGILTALDKHGGRLAFAGNIMGAAGIIINLAFSGRDFAEGNIVRGALGLAGVAGSAALMATAGSVGWIPGIGWGLILASFLGTVLYDINESKRVAEVVI